MTISLRAADKPVDVLGELAKISANTNALERLVAYDALAAKVPKPGTRKAEGEDATNDGKNTTVTKHGNWTLYASISPIDDKQIYTAVLEANETVRTALKETRPKLVIRLRDGQRLATYVDYDTYLGNGNISATVRYGTEKARTEIWVITSSFDAAFAGMSPDGFVAKLKKTDKFLIQLAPYGEGLVTTSFTLDGLNEFADTIIKQWKK